MVFVYGPAIKLCYVTALGIALTVLLDIPRETYLLIRIFKRPLLLVYMELCSTVGHDLSIKFEILHPGRITYQKDRAENSPWN